MTSALTRLKFGKVVLNDHFLPQLRLLLRSKIEVVRHEGVSILSKAVVNCSGLNSSLSSLRKLNRKRNDADVETDFFENSRHLQTHRRSRALLRYFSCFIHTWKLKFNYLFIYFFTDWRVLSRMRDKQLTGKRLRSFCCLWRLVTCFLKLMTSTII